MRLSVSQVTRAIFRRHEPPSPRVAPQRVAQPRARLAVALVLPAFALVLCGAWGTAELVVPEITDTDYHARHRLIRAAAAEHPNRPLGIVLGSSRLVWAFQPEQLTEADGVYWMNGAHVGAGPTLNRVILHRLLRDGVRPTVVALEVMPLFFVKENSRFVCGHFSLADMPVARGYADKPFGYDYHFIRHRLTRATDLARVTDPFAGYDVHHPRGGHRQMEADVSEAERAKRTAEVLKVNSKMFQSMTVRPGADRAFRDTLRDAADHGICIVLVRTPEGPTFRSWYNPEGLARFDEYVTGVASEHNVPIIDARLWLDEADFYDSHHVLKRGAAKFTARFSREVSNISGR